MFKSVAARVQRFKSVATEAVSAAQRFNIVAAQVESVAAQVESVAAPPSSKV